MKQNCLIMREQKSNQNFCKILQPSVLRDKFAGHIDSLSNAKLLETIMHAKVRNCMKLNESSCKEFSSKWF